MTESVQNIWCSNQNCGRHPSRMGLEPMYAIPKGGSYYFFCGECFKEIVSHFGTEIKNDLMNLLTHVSGSYPYEEFLEKYCKRRY